MKFSGLSIYLIKGIIAIVLGFMMATTLINYILDLSAYPLQESIFLAIAPTLAFAFLVFQIEQIISAKFKAIGAQTRIVVLGFAFAAAGLSMAIERPVSPSAAITLFLGGSAISLILLFPTIPYLDSIVNQKNLFSLLLANALGTIVSLFPAIFLVPFQGRPFVLGITTILFNLGMGAIFYHLFCDWKGRLQEKSKGIAYEIAILSLIFVFTIAISVVVFYFHKTARLEETFHGEWLGIIGPVSFVATPPWLAWLYLFPRQRAWWNDLRKSRLVVFIQEHRAGLTAAGLLFITYFMLTNIFDIQTFHRDDMFFDADAATWQTRLATSMWEDPYQRSLHPLILIVLRPVVMFLGYFLIGNNELAVSLLTAMAGAACVFLIMQIAKKTTRNSNYSLITAAIFGLSTTQLMFGSLIETYIFSALLLITFILAIQNEKTPILYLITLSVMTMGITLTNLFQNLAAVFVFKPNFKLLFRYAALTVSSVIALSLVNNILYPNANSLFFIPSSMDTEKTNFHSISISRMKTVARELFIYSEVAPSPIVNSGLTKYPRFWFHAQIIGERNEPQEALSGFPSLIGKIGSYFWAGLILISSAYFLRDLFKRTSSIRLLLALACILLFNFFLHTIYGNELFLYSPHVFYALVLFIFLPLAELTKYRWFLPVLCVFLVVSMANNFSFLYTMIHTLLIAVIGV